MWPFKRKAKMTAEEYANTRPKAPCGQQREHVFWTELQGMTCPACAAKAAKARKEQDENRLAEKIADAVARKLVTGQTGRMF